MNKIQFIWIILILFILLIGRAYAVSQKGESLSSLEQVEQEISVYYENPSDLEIPKIINVLAFHHALQEPANLAFITKIFQRYPNSIQFWLDNNYELDVSAKEVLLRAAWQSQTIQVKQYIQALSRNDASGMQAYAKELLTMLPSNVLQQSITSTLQLDTLWGCYYATGEARFVNKIISLIEWNFAANENIDPKLAMDKLIIVSAARWSLTRHAIEQQAVYEIIKAAMKNASPTTLPILRQIIQTANEQKIKTRNTNG